MNPVDHDGWQSIRCDTLRFYQTRGIERLIALKRHVTDMVVWVDYRTLHSIKRLEEFTAKGFIGLLVLELLPETVPKDLAHLHLSRACQLRRLYHLFGYDPMTWREAVGVKGVDEEMDVSSGYSIAPALSVDSGHAIIHRTFRDNHFCS